MFSRTCTYIIANINSDGKEDINVLTNFALTVALLMTLYLFSYSYIEAYRISHGEKVYGATFIFSSIMAFVFSGIAYLFI